MYTVASFLSPGVCTEKAKDRHTHTFTCPHACAHRHVCTQAAEDKFFQGGKHSKKLRLVVKWQKNSGTYAWPHSTAPVSQVNQSTNRNANIPGQSSPCCPCVGMCWPRVQCPSGYMVARESLSHCIARFLQVAVVYKVSLLCFSTCSILVALPLNL